VVITANGSSTVFDKVIIAAHAPDALALLGDGATSAEKAILGAFSYTKR
jgi:predicted NAD/FAD-binding protein